LLCQAAYFDLFDGGTCGVLLTDLAALLGISRWVQIEWHSMLKCNEFFIDEFRNCFHMTLLKHGVLFNRRLVVKITDTEELAEVTSFQHDFAGLVFHHCDRDKVEL
jgi:hypothetical protein